MEQLSLADAMRRGAAETRQIRFAFLKAPDDEGGVYEACALGAVAYANGVRDTSEPHLIARLEELYPELMSVRICHPLSDTGAKLWNVITDLNDLNDLNASNRWTRHQIADWLDSISLDLTPVVATVEASI